MTIVIKKFTGKIILIIILSIVLILNYNAVDNSLTNEDIEYIPKYLDGIKPISDSANYYSQIKYIIAIQKSVLNIAPKYDSIPFNQKREPKELYYAKSGLCYDRSRVIEKILRYSNFKTRHVSIYSTLKSKSAFKSLISAGIMSHAVSEVLTKKGWLIIDSNKPWISLDKNNNPISIDQIQKNNKDSTNTNWAEKPPSHLYDEPFTFVYGLYSRHGKSYPPYNFIPDINYNEFYQNFSF